MHALALCASKTVEELALVAAAEQRSREAHVSRCSQNDRNLTVSTVTEMRRDLPVSNADTQPVSTVTEMRRDSIVEIQTSQMSRPNSLYRD